MMLSRHTEFQRRCSRCGEWFGRFVFGVRSAGQDTVRCWVCSWRDDAGCTPLIGRSAILVPANLDAAAEFISPQEPVPHLVILENP